MPKDKGYNSSPNNLKMREEMRKAAEEAIKKRQFESAKMPKSDPKKIK